MSVRVAWSVTGQAWVTGGPCAPVVLVEVAVAAGLVLRHVDRAARRLDAQLCSSAALPKGHVPAARICAAPTSRSPRPTRSGARLHFAAAEHGRAQGQGG